MSCVFYHCVHGMRWDSPCPLCNRIEPQAVAPIQWPPGWTAEDVARLLHLLEAIERHLRPPRIEINRPAEIKL